MNIIDQYIEHGWKLCPIPGGRKGPISAGWNQPAAALKRAGDLPIDEPPFGVGLMHAYSGTMALDVDDWAGTLALGLDVGALAAAPDAVCIVSGRPNRGKLLYRMPEGLILPSRTVSVDKAVMYELRCGTTEDKTVQDVLPPSIHPDTGLPYQWAGAGHWSRLPLVPDHILNVWYEAAKDVRPARVDGVDASWKEINGALLHLSSDCSREDWVTVGMALHYAGTYSFNLDEAFHIWNEWSKRAPHRYPGERAIASQWASFKAGKANTVTLGSLYHLARQAGWTRPQPDASTLFSDITATKPVDIRSMLRPAPPPADLDLWPPLLATRAREVSEGMGCDPLVPLWAGLGAVCGAIDAQTRLELMPGFQVPPVLWLMTVGDPSDKKSPGSWPMIAPLDAIEAADRPRYKQELDAWKVKEIAYGAAAKAQAQFIASGDYLMGGKPPEVPSSPPPMPVKLKIKVMDITSQKLVRVAAERPRGVLCHLDEMSAWVGKLCNFRSGEDRSSWVVSYEAKPYEMDRVADGPASCENFAVSIYGNIQPKVLAENYDALSQDGLLQRFLPAVLRPEQTRLGNPMPAFMTHESKWAQTLALIYAMPAITYTLTPEAHTEYRSFQRWYEERKITERLLRSSNTYMTAFGKLEGLVGRLALVFHAIEVPFSGAVSADVMRRVISIVQGYVIPVYRHLYDGDDSSSSTYDQWVTDYIIQHADEESLTMSDIKVASRRQFEKAGVRHSMEQSQWIIGAMFLLTSWGWVRRIDDGTQEHRGQAEWLINPALAVMFKDYRKAIVKAKREIKDLVVGIAPVQRSSKFGRVKGEELLEEDG